MCWRLDPQPMQLLGGCGTWRRCGSVEGSQVRGVLLRSCWKPCPFLSVSASSSKSNKQFPVWRSLCYSAHHRPHSKESSKHGLKLWKLWAKRNLPLKANSDILSQNKRLTDCKEVQNSPIAVGSSISPDSIGFCLMVFWGGRGAGEKTQVFLCAKHGYVTRIHCQPLWSLKLCFRYRNI